MKRLIAAAALTLSLCLMPIGCTQQVTANTPPAALAPGYLNSQDQTMGQTLASIDSFLNQEKVNYNEKTAAQQAQEKAILNTFIQSVNVANALYTAYHQGSATEAAAQTAIANAQTAQTSYSNSKGVK
jgi:hypothetical protein